MDDENPVFKNWRASGNDWYMKDEQMTRYANAFAEEHRNPDIPYDKWLDKVGEAVREAFPSRFENSARNRPPSVDGGSTRGGGSGRPRGKTYGDLPQDAKMQCDKDIARGIIKSREHYTKLY